LDKPTASSELLRRELTIAAREASPNTALLLSGRIDSSALAALNPNMPVYTAGLRGSPDLKFARKVAQASGVKESDINSVEWASLSDARAFLEKTVSFMQSYDLGLLSDMVVYACMEKAKENGITTVRTGDPADEYFEMGGADIPGKLHLQSERIATRLGLNIDHPYSKKEVREIAQNLRREDNMMYINTDVPSDQYQQYERSRSSEPPIEPGYVWTKLTLRRAVYGILPNDVIYGMKAPLQYGAWTYKLTNGLNDDGEDSILKLEQEGLSFWETLDKGAHVGLYLIYKKAGLTPPLVMDAQTQYACSWCAGAVERSVDICYTCGGNPPYEKPKIRSPGKDIKIRKVI
jgi:hypothetical protein